MNLPLLTVVILAAHRSRCDVIAQQAGLDPSQIGTMHTACIPLAAYDDADPTHYIVSGPIRDANRLALLGRMALPENADIAASVYHVRTLNGLIQLHSADPDGERVGEVWSWRDALTEKELRLKSSGFSEML